MKSYKDRTSHWNGRQFQHMSEIIIHSVALKILNFYCYAMLSRIFQAQTTLFDVTFNFGHKDPTSMESQELGAVSVDFHAPNMNCFNNSKLHHSKYYAECHNEYISNYGWG